MINHHCNAKSKENPLTKYLKLYVRVLNTLTRVRIVIYDPVRRNLGRLYQPL